jgi:hypothetical protein
MSIPKYWRVMVKRGRKVHLTMFVPDQGSGDLALCGQYLPEDARTRGTPKTISEPLGDECTSCRIASGHLKRPARRALTPEEKKAIAFYRRVHRQAELLLQLGLSKSDAQAALENFLQAAPK